jgi:AcrR family transcriptional regulator
MPKAAQRSPRAQPRTATRDLILDQAERLIAQKGVNGFTLRDIVDPLGFQVPAIYKHYESRDDVLVALSRRFIALLSQQFEYPAAGLEQPTQTLRTVVGEFARFHIGHPAYVRLSLIDFATPQGGMEYIRLAAGGPFRSNLTTGPLAAMHRRLAALLAAGVEAGEFRPTDEVDFYRLIKSILLIRLVFPDDLLVGGGPSRAVQRSVEEMLWDLAFRYVTAEIPGA